MALPFPVMKPAPRYTAFREEPLQAALGDTAGFSGTLTLDVGNIAGGTESQVRQHLAFCLGLQDPGRTWAKKYCMETQLSKSLTKILIL